MSSCHHGAQPSSSLLLPCPRSVWREAVPTDQPFAGSHRLLLSWGGRVLDATELGQCRGWDRQITDIVSGPMWGRVARMQCSQGQCRPGGVGGCQR